MRRSKLRAGWKNLKSKVITKLTHIKHKPMKIGLLTLSAGALSGLIYLYRHKR